MSNSFPKKQPNRKERRRQARNERKANGETNVIYMEEVEKHPSRAFKNFTLKPKNDLQRKYINLIKNMPLVVGIGKAGTGKTFIPAVIAAQMLAAGEIDIIYIVRPNVELGRPIGFVKGTMLEKMMVWIEPVLDGLECVFDRQYINILLEREIIRVVPIAYMRGRTFRDRTFTIFDESENANSEEMECFTQRLGEGSKVVVCGDLAQKDITQHSGLLDLQMIHSAFENVPFSLIELDEGVRGSTANFFAFAYEDLNIGKVRDPNRPCFRDTYDPFAEYEDDEENYGIS